MPDWTDDEIVLVSAIEHYSYCPRQCALIHVEKVFDENVFTLKGTMAHERVDQPVITTEDGVKIERALPIWSEQFGMQGKADVVEFHPDGTVFPVEYKIDTRKISRHDDLQLCAEAICLAEMLDRPVTCGAVYSGSSRRRREVEFTEELINRTLSTVESIRTTMLKGILPDPVNDSRCPNCSLVHACMPSMVTAPGFDVFEPTDAEVPE